MSASLELTTCPGLHFTSATVSETIVYKFAFLMPRPFGEFSNKEHGQSQNSYNFT